jgi:DNA-binding MarR family transcriptional regulator
VQLAAREAVGSEAVREKRDEIVKKAKQTLEEDMTLDANDLPDEMDLASSEYLQSFTFRLRGREKSFLDKITKALAKIDDLGSVSQNQLGRLTAMDPATISGVIGRLTTRGYVQASPDPKDARVVVLALTPAGKAAITAMKAVAADVSRKTLEPLTAAEAAAFVRALLKLG